jgi:hypothetical protein
VTRGARHDRLPTAGRLSEASECRRFRVGSGWNPKYRCGSPPSDTDSPRESPGQRLRESLGRPSQRGLRCIVPVYGWCRGVGVFTPTPVFRVALGAGRCRRRRTPPVDLSITNVGFRPSVGARGGPAGLRTAFRCGDIRLERRVNLHANGHTVDRKREMTRGADAPPSIVNGHIDDAPRLVELSVIGVMFSGNCRNRRCASESGTLPTRRLPNHTMPPGVACWPRPIGGS